MTNILTHNEQLRLSNMVAYRMSMLPPLEKSVLKTSTETMVGLISSLHHDTDMDVDMTREHAALDCVDLMVNRTQGTVMTVELIYGKGDGSDVHFVGQMFEAMVKHAKETAENMRGGKDMADNYEENIKKKAFDKGYREGAKAESARVRSDIYGEGYTAGRIDEASAANTRKHVVESVTSLAKVCFVGTALVFSFHAIAHLL